MAEDVMLRDESDKENVPIGGTAEGVADDVEAKLSAGEMVIPEDVVRYYGVEYFMRLRDKAKEGFNKMAEMGQVGNSDAMEAEGVDTNQAFSGEGADEDIILSEEDFEGGEQQFNAGGLVNPVATPQPVPTFGQRDEPQYTQFMNGAESLKHFVNETGQTTIIPVVQGRLSFNPPTGFKEYDPATFPNPIDAAAHLFAGSGSGNDDGSNGPVVDPINPAVPAITVPSLPFQDVGPDSGAEGASAGPDADIGDIGGFGGVDIGDISPTAEAAANAASGTPQAISFSGAGAAKGAAIGALTGNPVSALMGAIFGGVTVADVDNDAVSAALGDDVEADIAAAGLEAASQGSDQAAIDGAGNAGEGGTGSGDVSVSVADTDTEGDVAAGGVGQGLSGISGEVETTSVDVDVDGGGGGGGGRIICGELYKQGRMPEALYQMDLMHADLHVSQHTINGYHWWAKPVVRKMRKSERVSRIAEHFARQRAETLWDWKGKLTHPLGLVYRLIGEPISWVIGRIVGPQDTEGY